MSEAKTADGKLSVFISYSRDDLEFVDQLDAILRLAGFETLLDRHGIQAGEAWQTRLTELIRGADTVVFVLSPSSAASKTCAWELEEAKRLGKRVLPVACRPLDGVTSPPPMLAALNYIFFYPEPRKSGTGFAPGLTDLAKALNTDLAWLREHTRYLQRASEWDLGGRHTNRLLSGQDIAEAKAWAARRPKDAPEPTGLHLDFIRASEQEEVARTDAERQRLDEMAAAQAQRGVALQAAEVALKDKQIAQQREAEASRQVVRRTVAGLVAALALAAVAGAAGFYAHTQKGVAQARAHEAEAANLQLQREYLVMLGEMSIDELLAAEAVPGEITADDPAAWIALMQRHDKAFALAGAYQHGRVLAVAHDGVLNPGDTGHGKTFVKRALQWLQGPHGAPTVVIASGHCEWVPTRLGQQLGPLLTTFGLAQRAVAGAIDDASLQGAGVLMIGNAWGNLAPGEVQAVERFVARGGGLLVAGLGWSWKAYGTRAGYACEGQSHGQDVNDLATYPMNALMRPYGLQWSATALSK